jgi:hypothetical protein
MAGGCESESRAIALAFCWALAAAPLVASSEMTCITTQYATGGMGAGPLVAAVQIPVHNESARRTAVKRTHTRPSK